MTSADPTMNALIELGVELIERGLVLGGGGNLSLRDGDVVRITRSGRPLHQLAPDDFLPVDLQAQYRRPATHPRPSTETPMHLAAYHTRASARVVVHCHPVHAIAWAMLGQPLPACTPDFVVFLGPQVPALPFALPGSQALGDSVAQALAKHPAVLLGNHGILVAASNVRIARQRVLNIDETARTCLLAAAAGHVRPLAAAEIAEIIETYGTLAND